MTSKPVAMTNDRTVTAFFESVRALNSEAVQVAKIPAPRIFRNKRQATSYLRELGKLELTICKLKMRINDQSHKQPEVANTGHANQTVPSALISSGTVLDRLGQMAERRELLNSAEFIHQVGWTRQALSKALALNRVFFVDFRGERYFPAFYAAPSQQRAQLEAVTKLLGDLPGGAKLQFFLNPRGSLDGKTPLEGLTRGKLQKVKDIASAFAEGLE